MPIHLIGEGPGHALPFNRTFFTTTLGEILARNRKEGPQKLTLFLTDGATLDLCNIEGMTDDYLVVRVFSGHGKACGTILDLVPYSLVYRVQLTPIALEEIDRAGFRWKLSSGNAKPAETSRPKPKPDAAPRPARR